MPENQPEEQPSQSGPTRARRLLLAGLVVGGTAVVVAGMLLWQANPPRRADRLLERARRKMQEIEEILSDSSRD